MKDQFAARRGGVDILCQRLKYDPPLLKAFNRFDTLFETDPASRQQAYPLP